jgi:hypothetical protein
MKRMQFSAMAGLGLMLLTAFTAPAYTAGIDGDGATVAFDISGPGKWEPGNLDRVVLELTPSDANGSASSVRVSLSAFDEVALVSDLPAGSYTVSRALYGLPDGSFRGPVALPEKTIEVTAGEVNVAPFRLAFVAGGDLAVRWEPLSEAERLALEAEVRQLMEADPKLIAGR